MKVIRRLICGGVLLVAGYITCWGQDGAKPTPLTMCELYEHPEQYSGKMVKVRGGSLGAELSISNVTLDGPVKTCSAFLDIIVLFPWQVNPSPGFDVVRDDLAAKHMLDLAPRFVQATGHHAVLLYKEEIELLMRTPGHAGFSLLDLHDYPGQGTALIGLLDPFWESKGFITPEKHRPEVSMAPKMEQASITLSSPCGF